MKVSELVERLRQLPQDATVVMFDGEGELEVDDVSVVHTLVRGVAERVYIAGTYVPERS